MGNDTIRVAHVSEENTCIFLCRSQKKNATFFLEIKFTLSNLLKRSYCYIKDFSLEVDHYYVITFKGADYLDVSYYVIMIYLKVKVHEKYQGHFKRLLEVKLSQNEGSYTTLATDNPATDNPAKDNPVTDEYYYFTS